MTTAQSAGDPQPTSPSRALSRVSTMTTGAQATNHDVMTHLVSRVRASIQRDNPRASLTEVWRLLDILVDRIPQLESDLEDTRYLLNV